MLSQIAARKKIIDSYVSVQPANEWCTRTEAKNWLNVSGSDEDELIDDLIIGVRQFVEKNYGFSILTQTVKTMWQARELPLRILRPPVQSITAVSTVYEGTTTNEASVAAFYVVGARSKRPKVFMKATGDFTASDIEEIHISTTNGFGDTSADIPQDLRRALYVILSTFYDARDEFVLGRVGVEAIPFGAQRTLAAYEVPRT